MANLLLAIAEIGTVMPIQEALESAGHAVTWQQGQLVDTDKIDAAIIDADAASFLEVVAELRKIEPAPALIALGATERSQKNAHDVRVPFMATSADGDTLNRVVNDAVGARFAQALSIPCAKGALEIEILGSREDLILQILRASRGADINLVQQALHWYPLHYVDSTKLVDAVRESRVLQIPEVAVLDRCNGSLTLQTLVRNDHLPPPETARLIWALASVGAVTFHEEPPGHSTASRAVLMARRHLVARGRRLNASTYYDVLEVPPQAEVGEIELGFRMVATRFSPDVLGALDIGNLRELARSLWNQILKARETLSDWGARARYADWLRSNQSKLNTNWAMEQRDLEQAESYHTRGQESLVSGQAHAAISHFAAAARAYPDHPDFECSLAYARFRSDIERGKERQVSVREQRRYAESYNYGRRPWPRALVALALLCAADGDSGSARWHVREALSINPRLPAARQLWQRLGGDDGTSQ